MRTLTPFSRHFFNDINSLLQDSLENFQPPQEEATHQLYAIETGWLLSIDLAGFERSEISLKHEDKALYLQAKNAGTADLTRETKSLRFALGQEVDIRAISSRLADGVLTVNLPRKDHDEAEPKQIQIN